MLKFIKLFIVVIGTFAVNHVFAEAVCIKNKSGVVEMWQVADKSSIEGAVPCPQNIHAQTTLTKSLSPGESVVQVSANAPNNVVIQTPQPIPKNPSWSSKPSDLNIRMLIDSWAAQANWKMVWAVEKDVPLISEISVSGDFKSAIRQVLDATVLADITLKPCFYTNQVVRVVRETTKCNPNE